MNENDINIKIESLHDYTIVNPNDKTVNAIIKGFELTGGYCPCVFESIGNEDYKCPCLKYRTQGEYCCKLYVHK